MRGHAQFTIARGEGAPNWWWLEEWWGNLNFNHFLFSLFNIQGTLVVLINT